MQFLDIIPVTLSGEDRFAGIISYWEGDPGRLSGPPEHCYPPEPEEVEWELCSEDGSQLNPYPKLTKAQKEEIESQVLDWIHNRQAENFEPEDYDLTEIPEWWVK